MANDDRAARRRFLAASVVPMGVCAALALRFAYDAPYWDTWLYVAPVAEMFDGTITLPDFFVRVNEHICVTSSLISISLARLTHWNIRVEIVAILLFYGATFGLLMVALRRVAVAGSMWAVPVIAITLFSFTQHAMWNWNLMLCLATAIFFVVVALLLLSGERAGWGSLLGATAAAWAATYSIGGALAVWPAGAVVIAVRWWQVRGSGRPWAYWDWLGVWVGSMMVAAGSYVALGAGGTRPLNFGISDVPNAALYLSAFLGGPVVAFNGVAAAVLGAVPLLVGLWVLRRGVAPQVQRFVVGAVAVVVAAGVLTALKHVHEGMENAISSRFLPWGTLAWCALAIAVYARWPTVRAMPRGVRAAVMAIVMGVLVSSVYGAYKAEERHDAFLLGRAALIAGTGDGDLIFLHPAPETLGERRALLVKYRLTVFRDAGVE